MRDILFRGKRIYDEKWIYGNLVIDNSLESHIVPRDFFFEDGHHLVYDDETDSPVFVFKDSVGQYTGLKDKNGKKIFEGDILSGYLDDLFPEEESRYEVIWHDYGWHIRSNGFLDTPDNGWLKENFEVIGNIHDNPELLKGSAKNE